jgi:penicillin-binding protein 2
MTLRRLLVAFCVVGCGSSPAKAPANSAAATTANADRSSRNSATLDPDLQRAAEAALREVARPSAVVAIDPNSGVVRALSSVPGERGDPLLTAHIPASTFKVFTAIAALDAGALTVTDEKTCTGTYDFAGKTLACVGVHGRETVETAVVRSCNGFFYDVGAHMEHAALLDVARRFGFGERTGIELPDDAGYVEDTARADAIRGDPTSTVPLLDAIGHGNIQVTLPQLARAFAVIANGGKLLRLTVRGAGSVEHDVAISPTTLSTIRDALAHVVDDTDGTAHDVAIAGYPISGKTGGDASPPLNGKPSGEDKLFVAYAPRSLPTILVAARVEHAEGTSDAKHVVREVLEEYRARSSR